MIDFGIFRADGEREYYEDYATCRILDDRACFIVNDGLGGHGKGDVASELAAKSILEIFDNHYNRNSFFLDAMTRAESELEKEQMRLGIRSAMKTTSVILVIENGMARWCHIGDTRLYLFRKGKIITRTQDHSVPQMLVASGDLKESKIRFHEDRNKLLKVLGDSSREIQPDLSDPISIEESTSFLLCTDGFWEWIDERQIQKFAKKSKTANEWVNDMGKYVITCGKGKNMDNATAITVRL